MLERRRSFRLSSEPAASTTVPARNVAGLAGQRVPGDELEVAAVVLHVLHEVIQQQVQTPPSPWLDARRQADLIDQQLGGVEHAGGLGEELVLRRAVGIEIGLVERARRFLDREVAARAGTAAAASRRPARSIPSIATRSSSRPPAFSRPPARSCRTCGGKKSSSQPWTVGISPDQKIERPPKFSCGFSPMKCCELDFPPCQNVSQPKCLARLAFEKRQRL